MALADANQPRGSGISRSVSADVQRLAIDAVFQQLRGAGRCRCLGPCAVRTLHLSRNGTPHGIAPQVGIENFNHRPGSLRRLARMIGSAVSQDFGLAADILGIPGAAGED